MKNHLEIKTFQDIYRIINNYEESPVYLTRSNDSDDDIDDNEDFLKTFLNENDLLISWIPFSEFEIIKKLGEGGFATVYSAKWTHLP
ncbi:serine/threonine protein kinase [Gigaspora margarita]|uniref:Serine/threonine protein kinase n=1 Tax=Gigaspora margarita TaxID=4874 RepID=A0A8H4B0R7_GIGMA|nr:serine/threonine protein kinase [Gigaspora margarita]